MYAIGIVSGGIPAPRDARTGQVILPPHPKMHVDRWAATLYEARQTDDGLGHWFWKRVKVLGPSRERLYLAVRDAHFLSRQWGECRVYEEGLGNKRIT